MHEVEKNGKVNECVWERERERERENESEKELNHWLFLYNGDNI